MLGTWIVVLKAFNISISCRTSLRLVVPMIRSLRPCPHNRASVKKGETREEASWECFSSPRMGNRKWMCKNTKKIVRLHLSASEFASINHTHLGSRSWSPAAGLIELRTNEKHQLPTKINLCWTILQMPLELVWILLCRFRHLIDVGWWKDLLDSSAVIFVPLFQFSTHKAHGPGGHLAGQVPFSLCCPEVQPVLTDKEVSSPGTPKLSSDCEPQKFDNQCYGVLQHLLWSYHPRTRHVFGSS